MLSVIVAIVMHCRGGSHPKGFIIGMAALSDDAAVFVWRSNDGQPTSWIGRVDGHGDSVWVQPIPNVATSTGGTGPLAIVDGVAVVRYGHMVDYHPIDSSAIAFDLTDGHVLWDHVLTPFTPHKTDEGQEIWPETLPSYVSDVPAGKALFSFAEDGRKYDSGVETRTIARTGAVTWRHPSTSRHFSPIAFGDDLALHYGSTAWLTAGVTGTMRSLSSWGTGCTLGSEYLVVERTDAGRGARLVAYGSADAKPRVIAANFDAFDGYPYVRACGRQAIISSFSWS